mmetsp:Transcript_9164/g.34236  ORF Transcript_9164/g.34236 Transcript_9164/m.34236 type:complete len:546 (+) Transcript_9164:148-1785(+)
MMATHATVLATWPPLGRRPLPRRASPRQKQPPREQASRRASTPRAVPDGVVGGESDKANTHPPRRASGGTFDDSDAPNLPIADLDLKSAVAKASKKNSSAFAADAVKRDTSFSDAVTGKPKKELSLKKKKEESSRAAQYMRELISRQVKTNQLSRAGSLADSAVLRRKGRLKEQDPFIEFIVQLFTTHETDEALAKCERWVSDALALPLNKRRFSNIYRQVPKLGYIFHPLPLSKALMEYDEFCALTKRKYVRPNFAEVRHIINIAQVHASAKTVKLVTFDADGTLYADGKHFEEDNQMIDKIQQLMEIGVHVAIVTAAGYPDDAKRFENRLRGLLDSFKQNALTEEVRGRFHVMGGECNYLLEVNAKYELEFIDVGIWRDRNEDTRKLYWYAQPENEEKVTQFLDRAQAFLTDEAEHLELDVDVMRKEYAVGILPRTGTVYENLEELSIGAMIELSDAEVPYCAFNGGNDVFVDVGNKNIGLQTLMSYLGYDGSQTLHVGDRFTSTGNDSRVREACSILWVASPDETTFFMRLLYRDIVNVRVL